MKPLGTQHIAEFINCRTDILNDAKAMEDVVRKGIEYSKLSTEKIISHQFNPVGVTVLAIISESHIGLHTYPESKHISLDVFTCSDPQKQVKFINYLKKVLKPKTVRLAEILRGNPIEFREAGWITSVSSYGFEVRYHIAKKVYSKKSKYQRIEIIDNEIFGRMLFLDKDLQIADYDAETYNKALIDPIRKAKRKIGEAVILGGGDGGILHELLKLNPQKVTLVDIDNDVIKASIKYLNKIAYNAFDDPRVDIIPDDAIKYIAQDEKKFDAIIYDLTMHPEAFTKLPREEFLAILFDDIKKRLNRRGILTLQVGSAYDDATLQLAKKLLEERFEDVKYYTVYIPSFCENWIFASARVK